MAAGAPTEFDRRKSVSYPVPEWPGHPPQGGMGTPRRAGLGAAMRELGRARDERGRASVWLPELFGCRSCLAAGALCGQLSAAGLGLGRTVKASV